MAVLARGAGRRRGRKRLLSRALLLLNCRHCGLQRGAKSVTSGKHSVMRPAAEPDACRLRRGSCDLSGHAPGDAAAVCTGWGRCMLLACSTNTCRKRTNLCFCCSLAPDAAPATTPRTRARTHCASHRCAVAFPPARRLLSGPAAQTAAAAAVRRGGGWHACHQAGAVGGPHAPVCDAVALLLPLARSGCSPIICATAS